MEMTTVTCHYCRHTSQLFTIEWPSKLFLCYRCCSVYEHTGTSVNGSPIWAYRFKHRNNKS